jgi:hypothetical protein
MNIINNAADNFTTFLADHPEWMFFVGFGGPLMVAVVIVMVMNRKRSIFVENSGKHRRPKKETAEEFFAKIDTFRNEISAESAV